MVERNGRFLLFAYDNDGERIISIHNTVKNAAASAVTYLNELNPTGWTAKDVNEFVDTLNIIDVKRLKEVARLMWYDDDDLVLQQADDHDDDIFEDVPYILVPEIGDSRILWHYNRFDGMSPGMDPEPKTLGSIAVVNDTDTYRKTSNGWKHLDMGDEAWAYSSWLELQNEGEVKVVFEAPA